jgi:hypothetical protein
MQTKVYMILMAVLLVLATIANAGPLQDDATHADGSLTERRAILKKLIEQQVRSNKDIRRVRGVDCIGVNKCLNRK